mmetsp:Transcript_19300/g.45133  ORF Transcript_19300/g.45133 Transcript_19300/m.45133 type:complete len:208 (+) Transcript_19300:175-798(+)
MRAARSSLRRERVRRFMTSSSLLGLSRTRQERLLSMGDMSSSASRHLPCPVLEATKTRARAKTGFGILLKSAVNSSLSPLAVVERSRAFQHTAPSKPSALEDDTTQISPPYSSKQRREAPTDKGRFFEVSNPVPITRREVGTGTNFPAVTTGSSFSHCTDTWSSPLPFLIFSQRSCNFPSSKSDTFTRTFPRSSLPELGSPAAITLN